MSEINRDQLREGVAYADRWLAHQQQLKRIPGVSVAIRFDDDLLLSQGYGFADLARQIAMTPQHIFRIASHSKTFTATAIMLLKERGKLRLDDEIGAYIPWLASEDSVGAVTIRQALNHAAGIVRDGYDADYWQLEHDFPDLAGLRALVEEGGRVLAPNESFKYSNIGYSLLGLVVEAAGGMAYNEYVKLNIVDRLGLSSTGPDTDDEARGRLVTGYSHERPGLPRVPMPDIGTGAMSPATGFYSTAEDLSAYAAAHFMGNEELLSDSSKREMQQPYWSIDQSDEHYGLGFSLVEVGERCMVGHGGGFPGHSTRTMFDPRGRLVVVVLTNETGGPASTLATGIVKIIDFALARPARSADPSAVPYERFAGRFVNNWATTDVVHFGNALVALNPDADDPVKNATELEVEDADTLRIAKTGGYSSPGERMRYLRDDAGQVTKVIDAGESSYPEQIYGAHLRRQASPPGI